MAVAFQEEPAGNRPAHVLERRFHAGDFHQIRFNDAAGFGGFRESLGEVRRKACKPCCRIFGVPHAEHRLLCFRLLQDAFAGNAPGSAPFRCSVAAGCVFAGALCAAAFAAVRIDPEDFLIIRHLSDRRKIRHELVHIHFSVHNVTSEGIWNFKFCVLKKFTFLK